MKKNHTYLIKKVDRPYICFSRSQPRVTRPKEGTKCVRTVFANLTMLRPCPWPRCFCNIASASQFSHVLLPSHTFFCPPQRLIKSRRWQFQNFSLPIFEKARSRVTAVVILSLLHRSSQNILTAAAAVVSGTNDSLPELSLSLAPRGLVHAPVDDRSSNSSSLLLPTGTGILH